MVKFNLDRITDLALRAEALAHDRSFIVQAPAGSGKTELLTQRYLKMLTQVESPEEILAVTFTRKAAAEMRNRIINAIYPPPDAKPRREETIILADEVQRRDRELGWQLERHPARMRIRTLDSVNAWLSATAPLVGQGGSTTVSEDPAELYREAALRTVEEVTASGTAGSAVRSLLMHLDNRSDRLVQLLMRMMARRDQWLDFVVEMRKGHKNLAWAREELEGCLYDLVGLELQAANNYLNASQRVQLAELLNYAANNLVAANPESPWVDGCTLTEFPDPDPGQLCVWKLVGELLLTRKAEFRKIVNKNQGFPAGKGQQKNRKDHLLALIDSISEQAGAADAFGSLQLLPEPRYTDEQWATLESLLEVLQVAAAQLMVVFAERAQADYPAVAQGAIKALVDDDAPTDLALRLDYSIRHILIDEFQDTSSAQLKLLTALTAGWQEGDGRTLFVVGDPMQSIYRFRKAEVGLFLELQRDGLPNLKLKAITLETNFRSDPEVMKWVNRVFAKVMPATDDLTSGAVKYAPGTAACIEDPDAGVTLHALVKPSRVDEAEQIATLVHETLTKWPDKSIGILVRSRAHAGLIVPALRKQNISFSGTALENTIKTPVVQDLLCLTRALSHRADRTAWLGLLRAPWCGLSLADLEALVGSDMHACIWDLLIAKDATVRMSTDGQARVARVHAVIAPVFERRGSLALRDLVEGVWVQLGGPAFLHEPVDSGRAASFFGVLDQVDVGGDCADAFHLHQQIADQLTVEEEAAKVSLLTIHKAKGLQFDTVILPALEAGTRVDDKPVLAWQEVVRPDGSPGLVIAPMEGMGEQKDAIFELARRLNKTQDSYERDRLLYVAVTRTRSRLHLYFGLTVHEEQGVRTPARGSLLARLWPAIASDYENFTGEAGTELKPDAWLSPSINRYADGWTVPGAPTGCGLPASLPLDEEQRTVTYDWAGSTTMHIGTVVHRWLQQIAAEGCAAFDAGRLRALRPVFRVMLAGLDVSEAELDKSVGTVEIALNQSINDERGQWLLGSTHAEAVSEYPLTVLTEGQLKRFIIDRSFVDNEGTRWIIDYKTSAHEGGNLEGFIDEEVVRYTEQLRGYRDAMQMLEPERVIRTALYFPLLKVFRELKLT